MEFEYYMTWLGVKIPIFYFLQETKLLAKKVEALKLRLGFSRGLGVDCDGRSGGVALFWRDGAKVSIIHFPKSLIYRRWYH